MRMKKVMKIIKYENLIYYIYRNIIKFNFIIITYLKRNQLFYSKKFNYQLNYNKYFKLYNIE